MSHILDQSSASAGGGSWRNFVLPTFGETREFYNDLMKHMASFCSRRGIKFVMDQAELRRIRTPPGLFAKEIVPEGADDEERCRIKAANLNGQAKVKRLRELYSKEPETTETGFTIAHGELQRCITHGPAAAACFDTVQAGTMEDTWTFCMEKLQEFRPDTKADVDRLRDLLRNATDVHGLGPLITLFSRVIHELSKIENVDAEGNVTTNEPTDQEKRLWFCTALKNPKAGNVATSETFYPERTFADCIKLMQALYKKTPSLEYDYLKEHKGAAVANRIYGVMVDGPVATKTSTHAPPVFGPPVAGEAGETRPRRRCYGCGSEDHVVRDCTAISCPRCGKSFSGSRDKRHFCNPTGAAGIGAGRVVTQIGATGKSKNQSAGRGNAPDGKRGARKRPRDDSGSSRGSETTLESIGKGLRAFMAKTEAAISRLESGAKSSSRNSN